MESSVRLCIAHLMALVYRLLRYYIEIVLSYMSSPILGCNVTFYCESLEAVKTLR